MRMKVLKALAQTIGTSAAKVTIPQKGEDLAGNGPVMGQAAADTIVVAHGSATNWVAGAFDRTATNTDFDFAVVSANTIFVAIPPDAKYVSLLALGNTITAVNIGVME